MQCFALLAGAEKKKKEKKSSGSTWLLLFICCIAGVLGNNRFSLVGILSLKKDD